MICPVDKVKCPLDNWTLAMTEIDPYPISALQDRYGLSSRQAIYDRINKLGIKPIARGRISSEQLDLLDELEAELAVGNTIDDFIKSKAIVPAPSTNNSHEETLTFDSVGSLIERIALAIRPTAILLAYDELEKAATKGWLLPTSIVKQLIGIKPRSDRFTRGSFVFVKSGKIGSSTAWKIEKI